MHERGRWIEEHAGIVALLLVVVPYGIAWLAKRAGVSNGWADLAQLVIGVCALAAVTVIVVRGRRASDTG